MGRTVTWVVNAGLFVLCCALLAQVAIAVIGASLAPAPAAAAPRVEREAPEPVSWSARRAIVERNLFDSTTVAPPPLAPPPEQEDLEATRLPLKLLGTASTTPALLSWAVVEDLQKRETVVVRIDDEVRPNASVMRIERRRIVLDENGSPRELALDEEEDGKASAATARRSRRSPSPAARSRSASSRRAASRVQVPRREVEAARKNPSSLFSQARIVPKYEAGEIVGLQINDPKPGSVFEQAGIGSGEVITEVNGIRIESAEESRQVMTELSQRDEWAVYVEGPGGSRTVNISIPQDGASADEDEE